MTRVFLDADLEAEAVPLDLRKHAHSGRGRIQHRRPMPANVKPIFGLWREIALAVKAGARTEAEVADLIQAPLARVSAAVLLMMRSAYLHTGGGNLGITTRCRRELRHNEGASQ